VAVRRQKEARREGTAPAHAASRRQVAMAEEPEPATTLGVSNRTALRYSGSLAKGGGAYFAVMATGV
jgi:hypothetical protein